MTNIVLIKRSSTANSVPTAGDLQPGELAINYTDGNLFFKNAGNSVQLITSQKLVSVTGNITGGNVLTAGLISATGNITAGNVLGGANVNATTLTGTTVSVTGNITGGNATIGTSVNSVFDQVATVRPLVVQTSNASTTLNGSSAAMAIVNGDTTANNSAQLNFAAITGASTNQYSAAVISTIFGPRTNAQYPTGILTFSTSSALNLAPTEKVRIAASGNVGIGNTAPTTTLGVTGTAYVSGNVTGGNISAIGNITGGNVLGGANVNATSLTGTTVSVTGNITGGNVLGGANVNATTLTGTTVSVSANITGGNVLTGGLISATGNVIAGGGIVPRVVSIADATSVTINAATTDLATQTNTQAAGTLTINAPTGTVASGQKLIFRLQSSNIQTFSWNAVFVGSTDLSLPTVSSGSSKYDYMGFIYNSTAAEWQILAKNFGF